MRKLLSPKRLIRGAWCVKRDGRILGREAGQRTTSVDRTNAYGVLIAGRGHALIPCVATCGDDEHPSIVSCLHGGLEGIGVKIIIMRFQDKKRHTDHFELEPS
jgi:hypothetical protein